MFTIYSLVSLLVKFYLGKIWGTLGISWGGAITYLVIIIPWVWIAYKKSLTKEINLKSFVK
jgi:hypothetical protein